MPFPARGAGVAAGSGLAAPGARHRVPGVRTSSDLAAIPPDKLGKPPRHADTGGVQVEGEPIRIGGQALPDGVMMRTDRAWAIARADGTVELGDLPHSPVAKVPVVRVIAGLGPALLLGLRGGGSRQQSPGRRIPWPLLRGLLLAQLAAVAANALIAPAHLGSRWTPPVAVGIVVLAIAVFRVATPAVQWRFHGAEHKAVAAHERGIDPSELDAVLACSRVHPRCGTNLIVWLSLAGAWMTRLPLLSPARDDGPGARPDRRVDDGRRPPPEGARRTSGPGPGPAPSMGGHNQ